MKFISKLNFYIMNANCKKCTLFNCCSSLGSVANSKKDLEEQKCFELKKEDK